MAENIFETHKRLRSQAAEEVASIFKLSAKDAALPETILEALTSQVFHDWYTTGRLESYICGYVDKPSKEEILQDIKRIFKV